MSLRHVPEGLRGDARRREDEEGRKGGRLMTAARRDSEPKTRMVRVRTGIVGAKVEEIEREVPADEPPPLGLNSDLTVVGKRTPRVDGRLKVTGAAKYTADVRLPSTRG